MRDADFPALRGEPDAGPFKADGRARGEFRDSAHDAARSCFRYGAGTAPSSGGRSRPGVVLDTTSSARSWLGGSTARSRVLAGRGGWSRACAENLNREDDGGTEDGVDAEHEQRVGHSVAVEVDGVAHGGYRSTGW